MSGYHNTADTINHTYRPLAIALLFGLLCLACILVALCACIGRTPRLTATLLVILWIFCGFVLLIGAGLLLLLCPVEATRGPACLLAPLTPALRRTFGLVALAARARF